MNFYIKAKLFFSVAVLICSSAVSAEQLQNNAQVAMNFAARFGGSMAPSYTMSIGSSVGIPDEITAFSGKKRLPVSGLSYSSHWGFNPVLLGVQLVPRVQSLGVDEDDSGLSWGWIAAGAAVVAGAVLVASDSDDSDSSGSPGSSSGQGGVACNGDECVIPCDSTGPLITCNDDG